MQGFISADMEGISSLVRWADLSYGIDFVHNCLQVTADANVAIEGACLGYGNRSGITRY